MGILGYTLTVLLDLPRVVRVVYNFYTRLYVPFYSFKNGPHRTDRWIYKSVGTIHWGLMLTVFCLSHTAFLLILKRNDFPGELPGIGLVLFLVIMTQLNDVFQFIWGKLFGRAKILPSVSPGKTWAGFIGGVLTCIITAWVLGPFLTILDPLSLIHI